MFQRKICNIGPIGPSSYLMNYIVILSTTTYTIGIFQLFTKQFFKAMFRQNSAIIQIVRSNKFSKQKKNIKTYFALSRFFNSIFFYHLNLIEISIRLTTANGRVYIWVFEVQENTSSMSKEREKKDLNKIVFTCFSPVRKMCTWL